MNIQDIFSYAFAAIRLRKLRAGLTTLGVVIGIAAIVALLSISQGLQVTIVDQLQKGFATNTLIVSAGGGFTPGSGITAQSDFALMVNHTLIIDEIDEEGVEVSAAIIQKAAYIQSTNRSFITNVVGVDFERYSKIYSTTFVTESGIIPSNAGNLTIVIGKRISDPWQNGTTFLGVDDSIQIIWTNTTGIPIVPPRNETYDGQIAGVLGEIGGFGVGPSDYNVFIPISHAQEFFGTDECNMIIVKLSDDDEATIENVSEAIKETFSGQVSVTSSTAVLSIVSSIFSTVELFLGGIAAISLLVAGIGIMNIMIVSLMERTREIGILKALGMKSRTVLLIFLSEAIIVGLMGATIGVGLGWGLANIVAAVFSGGGMFGMSGGNQTAVTGTMSIIPILTPAVLLGSLAFGVVVSVIFALYPAWRASRLKPVDALRYE